MAIKVSLTLAGPLGAEGDISVQAIDYSVTPYYPLRKGA